MENTIKFYANWSNKDKRYFVSGKNEKNKYYSLWKNPEFENEMYMDTDKFKGGFEIEKSKLKILKREDGQESKVLVFKNLEDELSICVSKEDLEKRRRAKKQTNSHADFVIDLFKCLFDTNKDLKCEGLLKEKISEANNMPDETEPIEDEDLLF